MQQESCCATDVNKATLTASSVCMNITSCVVGECLSGGIPAPYGTRAEPGLGPANTGGCYGGIISLLWGCAAQWLLSCLCCLIHIQLPRSLFLASSLCISHVLRHTLAYSMHENTHTHWDPLLPSAVLSSLASLVYPGQLDWLPGHKLNLRPAGQTHVSMCTHMCVWWCYSCCHRPRGMLL